MHTALFTLCMTNFGALRLVMSIEESTMLIDTFAWLAAFNSWMLTRPAEPETRRAVVMVKLRAKSSIFSGNESTPWTVRLRSVTFFATTLTLCIQRLTSASFGTTRYISQSVGFQRFSGRTEFAPHG